MTRDQVKDRVQWIDAGRGLSIVLVVFYHAVVWLEAAHVDVGAVLPAINDAAIFRMPLFFLIAGILAPKWMTKPWRELAAGKLVFIIWPFIVWQVAIAGYKVLATLTVPTYERSVLDAVGAAVLSPLRPNGESWFLWGLALYFVVCRLLWRFPAGAWIACAAIVSFAWSQFVRADAPDWFVTALGPGLLNVAMYFVFFACGARFASHISKFVSRTPLWVCVGVVLAWIGWAALSQGNEFRLEVFEQVVGVLAGLGLARILGRVRPLRAIGKQTLPIYLSHTSTIVVLMVLVLAVFPRLDVRSAVVLVFVLTLAGVVVGVVLNKVAGSSWLFIPPGALLRRIQTPKEPKLRL